MFKKILYTFLTVLLVSGLGGFVWYYLKINAPISETIHAIPQNAIFILETKNISNTWSKIKNETIWYAAFAQNDTSFVFEKNINLLDSIINKDDVFKEILSKENFFISAHPYGKNDFQLLGSINIPPSSLIDISDITKKMIEIDNKAKFSNVNYDEAVIYAVEINLNQQNQKYFFALYKGVFLISQHNMLVEDAIRQLNSGTSLMNDKNFEKVIKTAGSNVDANLYINYSAFKYVFYSLVNENYWDKTNLSQDIGIWGLFDFRAKGDALLFNGFTAISDSTNLFLNIFRNQKAQNMELTRILSYKTPSFLYFSYQDFQEFNNQYINYLQNKKGNTYIEDQRREFEVKYKKEISDFFVDWMGEEMALCLGIEEGTDVLVLKTKKLEIALKQLDELEKLTRVIEIDEEINYKNFKIKKLNSVNLLEIGLGDIASGIEKPFYTNIGKYIIISSSLKSINNMIDDFLLEKTLSKDIHYKEFNKQISSSSNFYFYSNLRYLVYNIDLYLNKKTKTAIQDFEQELRKIDGVAIQYSSNDDLVYSNIAIKYNQKEIKEFTAVWERNYPEKIIAGPFLVENHYTQENEILIQLENLEVLLIDTRGNTIWNKVIGGKIKSDVKQIDVYKNSKLQMIFNTNEEIYLLDRNGENVEDFPKKIKPMISNKFSLVDYENNKEYRVLIASANKKVFNYTATGEIVTGFDFGPANDLIEQEIYYFNIDGLDYIAIIDNSGKVYVCDRRGTDRIMLKEKLEIAPKKQVQFVLGNALSSTYLLSLNNQGELVKLNFTDELSTSKLPNGDKIKNINSYLDSQNSKRIMLTYENKIVILNEALETIFEKEFAGNIFSEPVFYPNENKVDWIGIAVETEEKTYLLDNNFNEMKETPVETLGKFKIGSLTNKEILNMIVVKENIMKNFQLAN
jgi:hypothetical protein